MKTVQDALDAKGSEVHWIDPLASVFDAAKMMNAHRVGALLVQIDGFLVGIVPFGFNPYKPHISLAKILLHSLNLCF